MNSRTDIKALINDHGKPQHGRHPNPSTLYYDLDNISHTVPGCSMDELSRPTQAQENGLLA
jgi:hypothetical protein